MSDFDCNFSMELKYPLDEETLDILTDAKLNNTNCIWFVTKSGKKVPFVKVEALDKAKTVIEEHIKINQNLKPNDTKVMRWCLDVIDKYTAESDDESCDEIWEKAYKEREAQPNEDCISRKAVLSMQYRIDDSATLSSRDVVNVDDIEDLPSVTPQQKTGHWIGHREHCEKLGVIPSGLGVYEWCSNCGHGIDIRDWSRISHKYCPKCGAKMQEVQK